MSLKKQTSLGGPGVISGGMKRQASLGRPRVMLDVIPKGG